MQLEPVNSTSIRGIGYRGGTLLVLFHSRHTVYSHPGVAYSVYIEFMNAPSLGDDYSRHIRGRYR